MSNTDFRDGSCTYAKLLVMSLNHAISEAERERVDGWEQRVIAYQMVIDGRLVDISVDDREWVDRWKADHPR